jgi:hypothetical protein
MSNFTADFLGVSGQFIGTVNFGTAVINRHAIVMASVTEISQPSGEPLDFPFIGAAVMTVHNIAPQDNGTVQLVIDTGWGSPLNIRLSFVVNPA